MIPKIIHYCWFGRGEMPELAKKCIASWQSYLPDYELREWNEDVFDVNSNLYVKQAYENRKYAFVTDYVRLYALYTVGGVYMDTDVEVTGSYDPFLHHNAFSGFENNNYVPTGMMAAAKGSIWAKDLLEQYNNRVFIKEDGTFDLTTNTSMITNYMVSKGLVRNNTYQDFPGLCTMYPSDFFCPKDHTTGIIHITSNTVCIHHFAGSWMDQTLWAKIRHRTKVVLAKLFGPGIINQIADIVTLRVLQERNNQ